MHRVSSTFVAVPLVVLATAVTLVSAEPFEPKLAPASAEAANAIQRFRLPTGTKMDVWAAEPLLANPVAFYLDEKGRCYVAETFRLHAGVTDNRSHNYWLNDDLACRTVADRVAMYRKHLKDRFRTYETAHDRIRLVEDSNGDGKADRASVFADGFSNAADGIGSGVIARKGDVWYTCIPDLWRLRDTKGTGRADVRESLSTGYGVHVSFIGHDSHGLVFGPDGKLYFSIGDRGLNVTTREGKHLDYPDTGAVLRCDPDGANLEVVAYGLRNPQELAFDDHGNLFTGDNNSDSGDRARWVHIVEGGDSGWRIGYQYDSAVGSRGPWNAEKRWHLQHPEQPAEIVPPLAHIAAGPSGLTYYPGTGLGEKYAGHFFLCDFRGSPGPSGVLTFTVKPKGASFEPTQPKEWLWGVLATDCDFGPEGGFYVSDWVQGWGLTGKGRIYRLTDPDEAGKAIVAEVKKLLAEGFEKRSLEELAKLLSHADRRVRQEAQFALADRGKEAIDILTKTASTDSGLSSLHAVWGLGQIARREPSAVKSLPALLKSANLELRAQSAKVLGDAGATDAVEALIPLLKDESLRVRFFAAQSLGKLGRKEAAQPVLEMLRTNADQDVYLRHAGVMALTRLGDRESVRNAATDPAPAVRLAALLTLRRWRSPDVASFLNDKDPRLVLEAARAIHDEPIEEAMPRLAALTGRPNLPEMLAFRVLNANFRLGSAENAAAVASYAARADVKPNVRVVALQMLGEWGKPAGRDKVMGLWRPLAERDAAPAKEALTASLGGIFAGPDAVRKEAATRAAAMGIREVGPVLRELVLDGKRPGAVRAEALAALETLNDAKLDETMRTALTDTDPRVRHAGRRVLAKRQSSEALKTLATVLENGETIERQGALTLLGELKEATADELLGRWLDRLLKNDVPEELRLDLLEATAKKSSKSLKDKAAQYEASRKKDDHLAAYRECLTGGDAESGAAIFFHKTELSCLRCHKIKGEGGEVGPELTGLASKQPREYLLEAITAPNRQIAKGFETVLLTLTNGKIETGIIKSEDAKAVTLMTAEGRLVTVSKDKIEERETGKSAMPEDLVNKMSKRELRDLVEFLAGLK